MCSDLDEMHTNSIYCNEFRCISRGNMLKSLYGLYNTVISFLTTDNNKQYLINNFRSITFL